MRMFEISSDILALTSEAVVIVRGGLIAFANAAAKAIIGADCVGKRPGIYFPPEIMGTQASCFVADAQLGERRCNLRVSKSADMEVFFLSKPADVPVLLNDALIYSLRSSLMSMGTAADICRTQAEELDDEELLFGVATLTQSCHRLMRLVSNITVVKDMLNGGISFCPTRVDIAALFSGYVDALRTFCPEVEFSLGFSAGIYACVDAALAGQLFLNLISNCLQHAKGLTRVNINLLDVGEDIILSIGDNGCGIPEEELHTVFSRYIHPFDLSALSGGVGMGLTVVRGIAQRHGGTLLLESRAGCGTSVRASFKKNLHTAQLCAPACPDEISCTKPVLTALSEYLPAQYYAETFLD